MEQIKKRKGSGCGQVWGKDFWNRKGKKKQGLSLGKGAGVGLPERGGEGTEEPGGHRVKSAEGGKVGSEM